MECTSQCSGNILTVEETWVGNLLLIYVVEWKHYSSIKGSKKFECLVTDREKDHSTWAATVYSNPPEQVTVKLKGL